MEHDKAASLRVSSVTDVETGVRGCGEWADVDIQEAMWCVMVEVAMQDRFKAAIETYGAQMSGWVAMNGWARFAWRGGRRRSRPRLGQNWLAPPRFSMRSRRCWRVVPAVMAAAIASLAGHCVGSSVCSRWRGSGAGREAAVDRAGCGGRGNDDVGERSCPVEFSGSESGEGVVLTNDSASMVSAADGADLLDEDAACGDAESFDPEIDMENDLFDAVTADLPLDVPVCSAALAMLK